MFKLEPHESKYSIYKEKGIPEKVNYNNLSRYEKEIVDKL